MSESLKQNSFEFEKVPVNRGDKLLVKKTGSDISFINEAGFETIPLPEGTKIKVGGFQLMIGAGMPEMEGEIHYSEGVPAFYSKLAHEKKMLKKKFNLKNFWGNDTIEILELPKS